MTADQGRPERWRDSFQASRVSVTRLLCPASDVEAQRDGLRLPARVMSQAVELEPAALDYRFAYFSI